MHSAFGVDHGADVNFHQAAGFSKSITATMASEYIKMPSKAIKGLKLIKKNPKLLIPNELRKS